MSTKLSAGAAKRNVNVAGKRLGVKKFGGEHVISGNIIIRQRGTVFHAGKNTKVGRDHTIYATAEGVVKFSRLTNFKRDKKIVHVISEVKSKKDKVRSEIRNAKAEEPKNAQSSKPTAKSSKKATTPKAAKPKTAVKKATTAKPKATAKKTTKKV